MIICPKCEQGVVVKARVKRLDKEIFICEECDTVWEKEISPSTGNYFYFFAEKHGCNALWDELEILER